MRKSQYITIITAVCIAAFVSGCGKSVQKTHETENSNVIVDETIPQTETELPAMTEAETEALTEKETEPPVTLDSVKGWYKYTPTEGVFTMEISEKGEIKKDNGTYQEDGNGIIVLKEDSPFLYMSDATYIKSDSWYKASEKYVRFFDPFEFAQPKYAGEGTVNKKPCSEVDVDEETAAIPLITCLLQGEGVQKAEAKSCRMQYYISEENGLAVIVLSGEYSSQDDSGTYKIMFAPSENFDGDTKAPENIIKDASGGYAKGTVDAVLNNYISPYFMLQLSGGNVITMDKTMTESLEKGYEDAGSPYHAEAYGSRDGGIVSITSLVLSFGESPEDAFAKYMTSTNASDVKDDPEQKLAGYQALCKSAVINNTQTKTFCLSKDKAALLITIYYKDDVVLHDIVGRIAKSTDDLDWAADTYQIKSYVFTTPQGYYIDKDNSSDVSLDMVSPQCDLYAFVYTASTVEAELKNDTTPAGTDVVTMESQENVSVPLGSGSYVVLSVSQGQSSFKQHEYLVQCGNDVIKYMSVEPVGSDGSFDYKAALDAAAQNTKIQQAESGEPETANQQ